MKGLVQLLGPTGIGKSAVALVLARRFAGEIVSADSLQVYRGFDIGTAKLSLAERGEIPHHLIDLIDDCTQFHAARFLSLSHATCEEILARGHLPLVCGGTLLYQRVMIQGIFPETRRDSEIRHQLLDELKVRGLPALFDDLRTLDPRYAGQIGPADRQRILRALEIGRIHHRPPTELFAETTTPFSGYRFLRLGLQCDRGRLYAAIDRRVEVMMEQGFLDEVVALRRRHPDSCPPFSGVGYRELLQHLRGEFTLAEAVSKIKQHTRNFAKRQLTWLRREPGIRWFAPEDLDGMSRAIEEDGWNVR